MMPTNATLAILMPLVSTAAMALTAWVAYAVARRRHIAWKQARAQARLSGMAEEDFVDLLGKQDIPEGMSAAQRRWFRKTIANDLLTVMDRPQLDKRSAERH